MTIVLQDLRDSIAMWKDSLRLIDAVNEKSLPAAVCYQGCLQPEQITAVRLKRIKREKAQLMVTDIYRKLTT